MANLDLNLKIINFEESIKKLNKALSEGAEDSLSVGVNKSLSEAEQKLKKMSASIINSFKGKEVEIKLKKLEQSEANQFLADFIDTLEDNVSKSKSILPSISSDDVKTLQRLHELQIASAKSTLKAKQNLELKALENWKEKVMSVKASAGMQYALPSLSDKAVKKSGSGYTTKNMKESVNVLEKMQSNLYEFVNLLQIVGPLKDESLGKYEAILTSIENTQDQLNITTKIGSEVMGDAYPIKDTEQFSDKLIALLRKMKEIKESGGSVAFQMEELHEIILQNSRAVEAHTSKWGRLKIAIRETAVEATKKIGDWLGKYGPFALGAIVVAGLISAVKRLADQMRKASVVASDMGGNISANAQKAVSRTNRLATSIVGGREEAEKFSNAIASTAIDANMSGDKLAKTFSVLSYFGTSVVELGMADEFGALAASMRLSGEKAGTTSKSVNDVAKGFMKISDSTVRNKLLTSIMGTFRFMGSTGASAINRATDAAARLSKRLKDVGLGGDEIAEFMGGLQESFSGDLFGDQASTFASFGMSLEDISKISMGIWDESVTGSAGFKNMYREVDKLQQLMASGDMQGAAMMRAQLQGMGLDIKMQEKILAMSNADKGIKQKNITVEKEKKSIEEDSAARMKSYNQALNDVNSSLLRIKESFENSFGKAVEALKPKIEWLWNTFEGLLNSFNNMPTWAQGLLVGGAGVAAVTAKFGFGKLGDWMSGKGKQLGDSINNPLYVSDINNIMGPNATSKGVIGKGRDYLNEKVKNIPGIGEKLGGSLSAAGIVPIVLGVLAAAAVGTAIGLFVGKLLDDKFKFGELKPGDVDKKIGAHGELNAINMALAKSGVKERAVELDQSKTGGIMGRWSSGSDLHEVLQTMNSKQKLDFQKEMSSKIAAMESKKQDTKVLKELLKAEGLSFAKGGVVPGSPNSTTLAMVHGGETIIPSSAGGGNNDAVEEIRAMQMYLRELVKKMEVLIDINKSSENNQRQMMKIASRPGKPDYVVKFE